MDVTIYHVARAGEILGEYSAEEFLKKRTSGEIAPTDHFWTEGMSDWEEVTAWKPAMAATVKIIPASPSEKPGAIVPTRDSTITSSESTLWQRLKRRALGRTGKD